MSGSVNYERLCVKIDNMSIIETKQIVRFLRNNILGKILYTPDVIYSLDKGNLEGIYSDRIMFSDLAETEWGIQFNMTTISREKVFEIQNKRPVKQTKDYTGTSVFRYELAFRKSTSQITGFMNAISTTVKNHTMEAIAYGVYDMKLNDDQLKWKESQLFYRDMPSSKGKYIPAAFDSDIRLYFENGKVVFEYTPLYYDVNPETMIKTLSKDKYPLYISKEK